MNHGWPVAVARRLGIGGEIDFTPTRVGQTLHVPCRGRGRNHQPHIVDVKIAAGQHPDAIAKRMLGMGWRMGHRLLCPDAYKRGEDKIVSGVTSPPPLAQEPTPTPAAGKARRLVYMALEDYYDEDRKAYKPGHSDEAIAKQCGVSGDCVRKIREESFGPLAVPLDLANVLTELKTLRSESETVQGRFIEAVEALTRKVDGLVEKNGWKRP